MGITVNSISKSFGHGEGAVQVLKDVSLTVDTSEICCVVGASGSGKSTLLNCTGGLDRPDSGTITVAGQEITSLGHKALTRFRRHHIGFVFQFYNLVPNLTARENIEVCEYLSRTPMPLDELIDELGLGEHQHKFPSQLSGGQQQRCAIARALVKRPAVLLCDEPTGALDYEMSREMLRLLEQVNQDHGTTVVIVTHNQAISAMAHRTVTVRDGRVEDVSLTPSPVPASSLSW
ncbi:ABC transporter ATP-binding protein [Actinomyces sp. 2119]|uniref:ABC transporter ATP-binding protein n=1 Tax=Actinomyces sp. 2119 TaxID=2321393 RepID=UPI000E6C6A8B|nr:ABC transporter ATP-binding protein [Actinomyces sp. 2119]RJF43125.1 ABC transporter ATP-binding protein [Actinomyces sp. 2119]